ncbi:hypothetical protein BH23BAC3_BH23BAC3_17910 [soil metagenome]
MMEKLKQTHYADKNTTVIQFDLQDRSRKELIQLAKNLSEGRYEKDSNQRRQILQMIADNLAENPSNPP